MMLMVMMMVQSDDGDDEDGRAEMVAEKLNFKIFRQDVSTKCTI